MDASLISVAVDEYVSSEAKFVDQMHIVLSHVYRPALKDPDIPQDLLESVFSPMKSILSLHESLSQALSSLPDVEDISIRLYAFICTILAAFHAQLDSKTGLTAPGPVILSLYTSHWHTLSLPADQWPLHISPSLTSLTHGCVTTLQCLAPDLPLSLPSLESLLVLPALRMQGACMRVSSLLSSLQAVLPAHHPDVEMLQSLQGVLERVAPLPQVVCVSGKRAEAVGACSRAKAWVCAEMENSDSENGDSAAAMTVNVYIDEQGVDLWRYGPGLDLVCEGEVEVVGAQVKKTISGSTRRKGEEEEWMWGHGGRVWLFNSCFVVVSDADDNSSQLSPTSGQMGVGRDIVDVEGWCVVGAVADVKYSATVEYGIEVDVQIPIRKLKFRNNASPKYPEIPESASPTCGFVRVLLGLGGGEEQEVWVRALLGVMRGQKENATRREREMERERERERPKDVGKEPRESVEAGERAKTTVSAEGETETVGAAPANGVGADGIGAVDAGGVGVGDVCSPYTLANDTHAHTHAHMLSSTDDSGAGEGGAGEGCAGERVDMQQDEWVDVAGEDVDVVGEDGHVGVAAAEQAGDAVEHEGCVDVAEGEGAPEHAEVGMGEVVGEEKHAHVSPAATHAVAHAEGYLSQTQSLSADVEAMDATMQPYSAGGGTGAGDEVRVAEEEKVVEVEEVEEVCGGVCGPVDVYDEAGLQRGISRDADMHHTVVAAVAWSTHAVAAAEEEKEVDASSPPTLPHTVPTAATNSATASISAFSSASASALDALSAPVPASASVPLRALPHTMSLPHVQYTQTHAHARADGHAHTATDTYAHALGSNHVLPAPVAAATSCLHTAAAPILAPATASASASAPMSAPANATVAAAASIPIAATHTISATDITTNTVTVSAAALPTSPPPSIPSTVLSHPLVRAAACRREAALSLARVCTEVVEGERRRAREEEEKVQRQVEHMREVLRSLSEDVVGNAGTGTGTGAGLGMGMGVGGYGKDTYS